MAVIVACGGGQATGSPHPRPTASTDAVTAPVPMAPQSEWQGLGATEVPPADVPQVSLKGMEVVNQTDQAVSDGDARAWAEALLRSIRYEFWAVSRRQDRFLVQSGLSSAPNAVFQPDLGDLVDATRAGVRVEYAQKTIRRLVLRRVPSGLGPVFTGQLFAWRPYAFYLDAVGPGYKYWIDPQGRRTVKTELAAGAPGFELVGGEMRHHRVLGDIFVLASDWDCLAPASRQRLAPLCNP